MAKSQIRRLNLIGAVGKIRTATFSEREHLVVPVVALVEGVIHAVNAESPELVRADKIAVAPGGWNGRPVFVDHPEAGGDKVSGNSPEILESAIGLIFNTSTSVEIIESKRLKLEAWIDLEKAKKTDSGTEMVRRLEANEIVEVSVGAFVVAEEQTGVFKGKKYKAVWEEITPDHLALLSEGSVGACSVEMGCGTPRAATVHLVTASGITSNVKETDVEKRSLRERLKDLATLFRTDKSQDDMSDSELRRALDSALYSSEAAYWGIDAVFPADNIVVYTVAPQGSVTVIQRSFTVGDDGSVKLGKERTEVEPVTRFEPVRAAEGSHEGCTCGGHKPIVAEGENMDKKIRVKALIDNAKTPYTQADEAWLTAVPEEGLAQIEKQVADAAAAAAAAPAPAPAAPVVAAAAPAAEPKPLTEAQWMEQAPPAIRSLVDSARKAEQCRRDGMISKLETAQKAYSKEELAALETSHLEKLLVIAGQKIEDIDFTGLGGPRVAEESPKKVPGPIDMNARMKAAAGVN